MARIRTIKPEFFTSEDICALSPLARLLYIALWCEADREGRLPWRPNTFKLRYLPADTCDTWALCGELLQRGLVVLYGDGLAYIPAFRQHQHINPREAASRYPEPGTADGPPERGGPTGGDTPRADDAPALPGADAPAREGVASARVGDASARVGDASARVPHAQGGREGKGKEGNTEPSGSVGESARARTPAPAPDAVPLGPDPDANAGESRIQPSPAHEPPGLVDQPEAAPPAPPGGPPTPAPPAPPAEPQPAPPLAPRKASASPPCPEGVDPQTWADWLRLRRAKSAPVTATVIGGAKDEAAKAGMTLNEFLREWCVRGSQGLKAAWLTRDHPARASPVGRPVETFRERDERLARERYRALTGTAGDEPDTIDVTASVVEFTPKRIAV